MDDKNGESWAEEELERIKALAEEAFGPAVSLSHAHTLSLRSLSLSLSLSLAHTHTYTHTHTHTGGEARGRRHSERARDLRVEPDLPAPVLVRRARPHRPRPPLRRYTHTLFLMSEVPL